MWQLIETVRSRKNNYYLGTGCFRHFCVVVLSIVVVISYYSSCVYCTIIPSDYSTIGDTDVCILQQRCQVAKVNDHV